MTTPTNVTNVEGLRFSILDEATPNLDKLTSKFQGVGHAAERGISRVKEFGHSAALGALGAVGLGFGFQAIYEKAKEANLELEDAEKKIAGVGFAFTHWQKGVPAVEKWRYSMEQAREVTEKLEESEGKLKIRRSELAEIYSSATQLGTRHNLTQEEMLDLTEKLGAAQKVLGVNAESASMVLSRAAMSGTVMGRDKFGMMLRGAIGDMKAFHKASEPKRFEILKKAMGDLVPAAEEMGKGMRGAMFDIQESVEQIFRDFTKPMFGEQTKSLREFAKHVTEIQANGKSIAQVWGEKLAVAFREISAASKFIAEHWKGIAIAWGTMKLGGFAKGGFGGLIGGAGAEGATSAAVGLAGVAAKANLVVTGFVAIKMAADAVAAAIDRYQDKGLQAQQAVPRTLDALHAGAKAIHWQNQETARETFGHLKTVFSSFKLQPGQVLPREQLAASLKEMPADMVKEQFKIYGLGKAPGDLTRGGAAEAAADRIATVLERLATDILAQNPDFASKKKPSITDKRPPVNNFTGDIHITQEFREQDPDRIFHRVIREVNDMAVHRRDSSVGVMANNPGGAG